MKQRLLLVLAAMMLLATGCEKDKTNDNPDPTPPPASVSDLSAAGTANCYLVHGAGDYSFDATVMGNGVSTESFSASKLAPTQAGLLWQDTPALLSDIRLDAGRVYFFHAGEQHGNAVIAVSDAEGKIL